MLRIYQCKNIKYSSSINSILTRCFGFERAGMLQLLSFIIVKLTIMIDKGNR